MSSETEKMLSNAMNVFNTKLTDRQVIKLEGMEDYLKVPQYKALVNLEKQASQLEVDAVMRTMNSRIAYLKAVQELRVCERRWLEEIRAGMESLEERNRIVKDVNTKMKKGDYSVLQPASTVTTSADSAPRSARAPNPATKPPILRRPEAALPPEAKPSLTDIKKKLAMMNLDSSVIRSPLTSKNVNKIVETPKSGPILSSKGSLDGSLVPSRVPPSPLSRSNWNVPAPNFDETIDTEPVKLPDRIHHTHRPLPTVLMHSPEETDEAEDTFPLNQPSLPYQTPTVPHSRPFLVSSMRKGAQQHTTEEQQLQPVRPTPRPTPTSAASASALSAAADPLSNLGLMRMKRPVLNSEVGKKLMGL